MGTYADNVKDSAQTQENLNPQQDVFPVLVRTTEALVVEEGPTIVYSNDISDMAIWDNAQTTWDGVDTNDEWDSYSDNKSIKRVSNPRQLFIERFGFNTLEGAGGNATWDTTNKEVTFTAGQILVVGPCFLDQTDSETVTSATLSVTGTGSFKYELSASSGSSSGPGWPTPFGTWGSTPGTSWEEVTLDQLHSFATTGSDLRIRITENGGSTGTITLIKCTYNKT